MFSEKRSTLWNRLVKSFSDAEKSYNSTRQDFYCSWLQLSKRCGAHDLFVKEITISLLFCGVELCDLTARNFGYSSLWVLPSSKVGMLQSGLLRLITMMIIGNDICRLWYWSPDKPIVSKHTVLPRFWHNQSPAKAPALFLLKWHRSLVSPAGKLLDWCSSRSIFGWNFGMESQQSSCCASLDVCSIPYPVKNWKLVQCVPLLYIHRQHGWTLALRNQKGWW